VEQKDKILLLLINLEHGPIVIYNFLSDLKFESIKEMKEYELSLR
jgi:hypothetical protein